MSAAPQTLTFLFTDIEGSTPLWDARPAAMRSATERHNALLREAIGRHGGNAFRVVGDAFCVAFPDAASAVAAAVDAQRGLCKEPWGDAPIHVRIGLHSGAVETAQDEIFRGPSLARGARVMSAAHGDQILATAATVALLDRTLPSGGALRDLGDHTLRGFARPERLYQLIVPGLRSEFPPIRTQEALHTNLPPALTSFIGRAEALADVREAIRASRMVTLVGPGGTGKTRLALEAAGELVDLFNDGVWLVELAPVADAALVLPTVASTLGARAEGEIAPLTVIEAALRDKHTLLLIDNCEHVVAEAANAVQSMLRALPRLHLVATSREALGVEGERIYRVPSLTMPHAEEAETAADVVASEAGALFVERARAVAPTFALTEKNAAAVARICRRLDGIPLALELAAARLTALSVDELARRVDDRFRLLTGGLRTALPRQRTLRALVDWSYDLLPPDEQAVLNTLAVFSGGFSLDAAERVCPAGGSARETSVLDAIEHLVAKSLVSAEQQPEAETRYRLLETIRQYAGEKLIESGQADSVRRRHFTFFLGLARSAAEAMHGPLALEWLDRLEAEHDNLRAALDWSADAVPAEHARLCGAMSIYWDTRGHFTEGWTRLEHALAGHAARDEARLEALRGAGILAYRLDNTQRSDEILCEAIALARELGDTQGETDATISLAINRTWQGADGMEPLALRARELATASGDVPRRGLAIRLLGRVAMYRDDYPKAQSLFLESARLLREAGCVLREPLALQHAGECAFERFEFAAARRLLDEALIGHRRMGNVHDAAGTLRDLGRLALNEQRLADASDQTAESLTMFRALHDPNCAALSAAAHAAVLCATGDVQAAMSHAETAAATFREQGSLQQLAGALVTIARVQSELGDVGSARQALRDAFDAQLGAPYSHGLPKLLESIASTHPDAPVAPVLLGSAAALREHRHLAVFPAEREDRDRCYAAVRAKYAGTDFDGAVAAGRALTRDQAIESALALLKDLRPAVELGRQRRLSDRFSP